MRKVNKQLLLQSKLLNKFKGITHGFGTKYYDEQLNTVTFPHQVHGNRVLWVNGVDVYEADGLVTDKKGITIGVKTADCVPILLFEPAKNVICAVHAGWKGTLKSIVNRAVRELVNVGGKTTNIIAAIGPSIRGCCYDFNRPQLSQFLRKFPHHALFMNTKHGDTYLDLAQINKWQLLQSGLLERNIDMLNYCTCCRKDIFHSYHRDGKSARKNNAVSFINLASKGVPFL